MTDAIQIDRSEIEAQVKRAMQGDQLAAVTARFKTTSARVLEKPNAKTGNYTAVCDVVVLKDENDANSEDARFEETLWITLPLRNPDIEGHRVDLKTQRETARILHALFPDRVPYVSKKDANGAWRPDREVEAEETTQLVDAMVLATEIRANPKLLEDKFFYAKTAPKTTGKGSWFNSVSPEKLPSMALSDPSTYLKA
jgi:hypothetical protein